LVSLFLHVVDGETIRSWPFFLPDFLTHASIVATAVWAVGGPLTAHAPPPKARKTAIVDMTFA
jgi:hypothetical protein